MITKESEAKSGFGWLALLAIIVAFLYFMLGRYYARLIVVGLLLIAFLLVIFIEDAPTGGGKTKVCPVCGGLGKTRRAIITPKRASLLFLALGVVFLTILFRWNGAFDCSIVLSLFASGYFLPRWLESNVQCAHCGSSGEKQLPHHATRVH